MLQKYREKTHIKGRFTYLQVILIIAIMLFSVLYIRKTISNKNYDHGISDNQEPHLSHYIHQTDTGF
jgi:hypothetical protein